MWFIGDPARLERERAAVAALIAEVEWLQDADWRMTSDGRVKLDFTLVIGDRRFLLRMTYPKLFPYTPPEVAPVGEDRRLSSHQYGDANGNLCLQYRPDNWVPTLTGADMIRSAHELLAAEQPAEGPAREVPSEHHLTAGQELRFKKFRFLLSAEALQTLGRLDKKGATIDVRFKKLAQCFTIAVDKIGLAEGDWTPPNFPRVGTVIKGVAVRLEPTEFDLLLGNEVIAAEWRDDLAEGLGLVEYADKEILVATDGDRVQLAWQLSSTNSEMIFATTVAIDSGTRRLPTSYDALSPKRVAIVGCGSAGSKIAVSLARSGVSRFVLVDHDLFLRDNFVRNDLDWRSVGEHKADGVARRIRAVAPNASISIRRIKLSGQESAATAASALDLIAGCDLIVDATADPLAFNLLASVCSTSKKAMVWLEVFAGGIGGLVARYVPGVDAKPQIMRNAYSNWCRNQAVPWLGDAVGGYAAQTADGPVLVADDGDVSVVAAHAARMAVDALVDARGFPHPMYVVSLRAGWIFDQPFEAYPIDVETQADETVDEVDPEEQRQGIQFIVDELLNKVDDETSAA